jgi:hypothetical protein
MQQKFMGAAVPPSPRPMAWTCGGYTQWWIAPPKSRSSGCWAKDEKQADEVKNDVRVRGYRSSCNKEIQRFQADDATASWPSPLGATRILNS